jgi:hypothetical protein
MTVVGKVLVFVNLGFSLGVAFLIMQSYTKRTDWARAYNEASAERKKAEESRNLYADQAQQAIRDGNARVAKIDQDLIRERQEKVNHQTVRKDLESQIETLKATVAKYNTGTQGNLNEVDRLSKQADKLQQLLVDANKRLDDKDREREEFRQRAVKAEIDNKSLISRNNDLLKVIEEKEQDIIRIKASGGRPDTVPTSLAGNNPPPADVSGRVKNYDPTSGLLTITIGSDAGLLKNHTLQVYRLEPRGDYVGVIKILEVRPNEAVGKFINKPRTPVQVNDKVANKIS